MAEERPNPTPPVVFWYRIYCAGMTALYLAVIVLFAVILVMGPGWLNMEEMSNWFFIGYMVLVFTLCGSLALVFLMALFLKNRPWT